MHKKMIFRPKRRKRLNFNMNETKNFYEIMFGKREKLPAVFYDRSVLQLVATCPQQAALTKEYEKELQTEPMPALPEVGSLIHDLAKEAIKANEQYGNAMQEAADYLMQEIPKIRPDLQPDVLRVARSLAFKFLRFQTNKILLCEEQISRAILPATSTQGETLITTAPDLTLATYYADTIIVIDYKTGWKRRDNLDAQDDFQTCVISWVLFGKYPELKKIHFWYLQTRVGQDAYCCIERDKIIGGTAEQPLMQETTLQSRILEAVRLIQNNSTEAWPVYEKCCQCRVARWCKYITGDIADFAKEPTKYLDQYQALSGRVAQMEDILTEAVKGGRIIVGTTGVFDDSPKKKPPIKCSFKVIKNKADNGEKETE